MNPEERRRRQQARKDQHRAERAQHALVRKQHRHDECMARKQRREDRMVGFPVSDLDVFEDYEMGEDAPAGAMLTLGSEGTLVRRRDGQPFRGTLLEEVRRGDRVAINIRRGEVKRLAPDDPRERLVRAAKLMAGASTMDEEEALNIIKAACAAADRGCSPWTVAEAIWIRFLRAKDRPAGAPTEEQRVGSLANAGDVIAHYTPYERSQATELVGLVLQAGQGGVPHFVLKDAIQGTMTEDRA